MKNLIGILLISSFTFINACQDPNTPNPSSSATSKPQLGILKVTVSNGSTGEIIKYANIKITSISGVNKTVQVNDSGFYSFEDLSPGVNYDLEVSSDGFITNKVSTETSNINIESGKSSELKVNLFTSSGSLSGRLLTQSDLPIEAAVIKTGNNFSLSDKNGNFKVNVTDLQSHDVEVYKAGFEKLNYGKVNFSENSIQNIGSIKLTSSTNKQIVLFDTGKTPLNGNLNLFTGISNLLTESEYQVTFEDFSKRPTLNDLSAIVIASPSSSYTTDELSKLESFVKSGKKLIIMGEWGGYGGFNADSINNFLKEANIKINIDLIRESYDNETDESVIISTSIKPHYLTTNTLKLGFYGSASVEVYSGGFTRLNDELTQIIAYSSSTGYQIKQYKKGQFGLVGISMMGIGKIVVIGDSSIFTSDDSDNNGIININEFDNKILALNIFSW